MIDSSMLPDFIVEAVEHLEEMESSLLRLEQDYADKEVDKEVLDEIFRSIHTIKGAAQFVGIERVSELSHKLENLLDLIRRKEISLNATITDLLIAGKDRLTLLVDELERTQAEETEVADLVERLRCVVEGDTEEPEETDSETAFDEDELLHDEPEEVKPGLLSEENMSDEHDEELYSIFLQQLKENIPFLYAQTVELSLSVDKQDVLYRCSDSIKSLKSSANYMGYEKLTQHYSNWQHAIENAIEQLSSGRMPDLNFMQDYLDEIIRSFPQAMEGYSQDDEGEEEREETASIDSALDSIFSDEDPASASETVAALHEDISADDSEEEGEAQQGIDLDKALDSIFSDEQFDVEEETTEPEPESEADSSEFLTLSDDSPEEEITAASMAGAETVPLENELAGDEYDEELISIFLKKLRTDIENIQGCVAECRAGGDKETLLENCHEAVGHLASSANYMEYSSLTAFCEAWQNVVEGYLADVSAGLESDVAAGMQEFIDKIFKVYPEISEENSSGEEVESSSPETPESEDDFFADDEFLTYPDSSEKDTVFAGAAEAGEERNDADSEKTGTQEKTSEAESKDNSPEDKKLFDKLTSALDASEHAAGAAGDSINSVIEEIIEPPRAENGHARTIDIHKDSSMKGAMLATPDKAKSDKKSDTADSGASGTHLLDKVLAGDEGEAEKTEKIEAAAVENDTADTIEEEQEKSLIQPLKDESENAEEQNEPAAESKVDFIKAEFRKQEAHKEEQEQKPAKQAVRSSIRVDADKIDYLMNQVGELVVSRAYFAQLVNEMRGLEQQLIESSGVSKGQLKPLHEFSFRLSEAGVHLGRVSNELQEGVMKIRMLPIDQLFKRYPRLVRDLVHNKDKDVKLITKGEETELDKMVIESISDPLIHIIRNSVDHGIETVKERRRVGKPAQASLVLEAFHESDHIVLEITDDGRGIDTMRIRAKALEKGIVRQEELERMSEQELIHLVMLPGFSTAEKATKTSGRGVGMDVVKKNIEKLNGTVEIVSEKGKGTRLRIKIPLTMAIIQALMVRVGQEKFTIPLTTVEETLRVFRHEISEIEGVNVIHLRESTMPIFQLAKIYNIDRRGQEEEKMFVVVVSTGTQELGLVVDELLGQEEVVIKPLADYLRLESGFGGATIMGDGGISLILDIPELVKIAKENQTVKQEQRSLSFKRKKRSSAESTQPVH